jgi:ketosteroid isomerase-like protein
MAPRTVTDEELAALIERIAESASAYMRGDMRTYFSIIHHADDYTLMPPFGGETMRGFNASPERIEALERYFQGGEAELEVVETYTSGDLVVLAAIERQHGEVGGLPDQDWSLRVTLVFRREKARWLLVHRHADPMVHEFSLEQIAVLARGRALIDRQDGSIGEHSAIDPKDPQA